MSFNNQGLNNQGLNNQSGLLNNNQGLGLNQGLNNQGLGVNQGLNNQGGLLNQQNLNSGFAATSTSTTTTQTLGVQQTGYVQSNQRASLGLVRAEPTVMETIQKDVVVHERIHPVQKEEIQPVIYREREQLDVKQVTQMMHETQIQPTIIQQRELPGQTRETIVERGAPIAENFIAPISTVDATTRTQVVHAPIVNEVIKKTIIEEIQPVLERDIITSTVIQNTQPIYEKVVEAPVVYRETIITSQDRGVTGGSLEALQAQGFNLGTFQQGGLNQGVAMTQGVTMNQGLATGATTTTYVNATGNRRSLAEALPTSYGYLAGQENKLAEAELLNNNTALPAKTVL